MRKKLLALCTTLLILLMACSLPFEILINSTNTNEQSNEGESLLDRLVAKTTSTPTPTASTRLTEAEWALFSGDLDLAQELFQQTFDQTAENDLKAESMYGIGRCYYAKRDYASAIDTFNRILGQFSRADVIANTYFMLAESYYKIEEYSQAANAYGKYAQSNPSPLGDIALTLQGDSALNAGDYNLAITAYQSALLVNPATNTPYLNLQIGKAYDRLENFTTAIQYFMSVYETASDEYTKSTANLLAGQAYMKLGRNEEAYTRFLDSVVQFPRAYDSYTALSILVADGVPVNEFQRGLVNYYAGSYDFAVRAFERYLDSNSDDNDGSAHYFKGLSHYFQGEYGNAIAEYDMLINGYPANTYWPAAWDEKAHVQWVNLNQSSNAIDTYLTFVSQAPTSAEASAYLFEAGRVAERASNLEEAASIWQRMMDDYPSAELSYRGLFLAGISYFRLNRYEDALSIFQRSLVLGTSPREKAKAYLWIGKCHQALGLQEDAIQAWETASLADPTNYYSIRANELLEGLEPFSFDLRYDFGYSLEMESSEAEAWLRSTFNLAPEINLNEMAELAGNPRVKRIKAFWEVSRYRQAINEAELLRAEIQTDIANSYRLLNYLVDLHLYQPAVYIARNIINQAGMDDLTSLTAPIYFSHIRFGAYFRELLVPIANNYEINPLLFYALVRQESMFNPYIASSAGASGLAQIMPATAKENVDLLRWPPNYDITDLQLGKINLTIGAFYLNRMVRYFSGNQQAALAAYNAGPGNAEAWLGLANGDPDLFLEVIRFQETQNYLMQINEFLNIYKLIYTR